MLQKWFFFPSFYFAKLFSPKKKNNNFSAAPNMKQRSCAQLLYTADYVFVKVDAKESWKSSKKVLNTHTHTDVNIWIYELYITQKLWCDFFFLPLTKIEINFILDFSSSPAYSLCIIVSGKKAFTHELCSSSF